MTTAFVVSRDPALLDEVGRLVAAAGVALVDATDEPLRAWPQASLVLVGADRAEQVARLAPPRRPHVFVVSGPTADPDTFRSALALGAEQVVELPAAAAWLSSRLADLGEEREMPGRLLAVLGGSGGAGATTFACALGQVAARTGPAVVVDADPFGPGVDRVLGLDDAPGVRWETLGATSGRLAAGALRESLPRHGRLGVLTWPAGPTTDLTVDCVRETLSAAVRGHDVAVVDLPRTSGAVLDETIVRADLVVMVVRPSVASVAATTRWVGRLSGRAPLGLVTRGPGLPADELAAVTAVPVLAEMRDQRGLVESVDLGLGPVRGRRGPLARAARRVLEQVTP